jgi:serine phosphatase RsbU (regulator of sigma subunit)
MASQKFKIRKVIFGIRFKFSIIIILAVLFVSTLIGFVLLNQQESKIKDALQRQGTTILEGISDEARLYLSNGHLLSSEKAMTLSPKILDRIAEEQNEAMKKMSDYFASVIGKEVAKEKENDRILDIAYLIDINWKDIGVEWNRWDQALYYYFNRLTGAPFIQKNGRNDPLLEPTIVRYYMNTVDTGTYIGFASKTVVQDQFKYLFEGKPDYVIVGIPILLDKTPLYDEYIKFKRESVSRSTLQKYLEKKKDLPRQFIRRIINHGLNLNYLVDMKSEDNKRIIFAFLLSRYYCTHLKTTQVRSLNNEFAASVDKELDDGFISISRIEDIWKSLQKKYFIPVWPRTPNAKLRQECYYRLMQYNVPVSAGESLDELAIISFKKDLAGILGLYLYRTKYFPEMIKSQNEIINIIISILLRAIFLALLFPTFIIRSIRKLADGAVAIGKGNLDKNIDISGSDEIGRLADIFNVMAMNLKNAELLKIEKIRMEQELLTAQEIQAALLPEKLPAIKGMEFGAYYSAQTESGGDYYDFIDLGGGRLGITIADVSGHGVGSGLVMAITRTLLHVYCTKTSSTKKIFEIINEFLKENTASTYFVTMFYGILDLGTHTLTYSSAGHCLPMVLRGGTIRQLPAGGIALGVVSGDVFSKSIEIKEIRLQKGDYFIQYTDGVYEAMDARHKEFGLERFQRTLRSNEGNNPQEMIKAVVKEIHSFTGNIPQHDDITMIIFRIR